MLVFLYKHFYYYKIMKIKYCSDLHLEMNELNPELFKNTDDSSVLILAGDIMSANYPNTDFLSLVNAEYPKVFYVFGNHEHYQSNYDSNHIKMINTLEKYPNITLLNNECIEYNGWGFYGGTLWTNFNKQDPLVLYEAKYVMNDYKWIHTNLGKFTPSMVMMEFNMFLENIKKLPAKNTVVISHHLPSYSCIDNEYAGSKYNHYYASDLDNIIIDNPNIKYWFYGHTHQRKTFMIDQCMMLCNAYGYYNYEQAFTESFLLDTIQI